MNGADFAHRWGAANKAVTTEAMLEHLARSLATGLPSIVLSHHNVTPVGVPRLDALAADDADRFAVEFARPVRAAAPGQALVLYRGTEVVGGGTIESSESSGRLAD